MGEKIITKYKLALKGKIISLHYFEETCALDFWPS